MNSGERRCTSIEILDDAIVEQTRERFTENIRVQFRSDAYVDIFIRDNDGEWYKRHMMHVEKGNWSQVPSIILVEQLSDARNICNWMLISSKKYIRLCSKLVHHDLMSYLSKLSEPYSEL